MSDSGSSSQESRSELAELKAQMSEMMKMIQGLQKSRSLDENTSTPIVTQPPPESAPKVNQNISTETGQHKETTLKWPTYGLPPNYNPLYEDSRGFIAPIIGRVPEPPGPWFNPNVTCAYHFGVISHSIEHCRALKYKVQHLVDTKQLTFEDAPPDVHKNPLPNHSNQGINVVEGEQRGSYIWEVPEIKIPMKVIFQEMCKHGMVEKLMEDEDPNSCEWHGPIGHTLEDCSEFRLLLQKMLDMRLITVESGPSGQSVNVITQGEGDTSQTPRPSMTRFCPGRHGLGYEPTRKDWEKAAEEKRKGRMARLGQFEYKARGILIPHICQSFISAGFASGTIAVVGGVGPGNQTNYVIQCPPGTVLNNWTEEDVSPRVFYENM
ncbi:hypothetical protein Lal_00028436 [Lupinus albus]|nr:hypothetical protein Lal_00028436 [Lupinus albus]